MEDTGFRDETFDIVYNVGGINETDVRTSFRETWRIAKRDSLIIVSDENFDAVGYWHKLKIVFWCNLSFMDTYKFDGKPSRPPKHSVETIDEFLNDHAAECDVYRAHIPGLFYTYIIRKRG